MLKKLRAKLRKLTDANAALVKAADKEGRDLTAEEIQSIEDSQSEIDSIKNQINVIARNEEDTNFLNQSQGQFVNLDTDSEDEDGQPFNGGAPAFLKNEGKNGFKNSGEFLAAVAKASRKNNPIMDERLAVKNMTSTEVGEDGGFAIPDDFRTEITQSVTEEHSLLNLFDPIQTNRGGTSRMVDQNNPSNPYGIEVFWTAEGKKINKTNPKLERFHNPLEKIAALVPVSNESLEDSAYLASLIRKAAPGAIGYAIDDALINGNGMGKPHGILQSSHLKVVAKENTQAANTIVTENVVKMLESMPASARKKAFWLSGLNTLSQLMKLKDENGNSLYVQNGSLASKPYDVLLGRPKYEVDHCEALGSQGDLALINPDAYEVLMSGTGMKSDFSTHIYFDYDKSAFRFTMRIGGKCPFSKVISRKNVEQSNFVTLAKRS